MDKKKFLETLKIDFSYIYKKEDSIWGRIDEQFEIYKNFLQKVNKYQNLTRLDDDNLIYQQYFYSSIIPYHKLNLNNQSLLDIGSGSGIPGIALKIIFPHLKLTIIEANQKKVNFLSDLVKLLNLNDVTILNVRAENANKTYYEKFDYVTARAVASLKVLLEICAQFLSLNGFLIIPKGLNYLTEWETCNDDFVNDLGLKLTNINFQQVNDHSIYTFYFQKYKTTSPIYPRAWKDIIK